MTILSKKTISRYRWLPMLGLVFLLCACGNPVPPEKSAYVGEWRAKSMFLRIEQAGRISYVRVKEGGVRTSINGPIKGFVGNDFEVGIGSFSTVFVVSRPPFEVEGKWFMIVDGVELAKVMP